MKNILSFIVFLLISIIGFAAPVSNFSVNTICGSGNIQFTDLSTGATNAVWNFGNGATLVTLSGSNPIIEYSKPGFFNVTLTSDDGLGNSNKKIVNVFVPAIPVFDYGVESVCMSTELAGSVTGINPVQDFSALNGKYTPTGVGLGSYFNQTTGRITYNIGIGAGTYKIKYTYSVPGCNVEYVTTGLGIGNATIGPFAGNILTSGECNRIRLVKSILARGALQWQISNTFTGGVFQDLPSTGENLHFTNTTNESYLDNYTTPTLTVTSRIRLQLSDLYCGILDNSANDQLFTVAGLTDPGILSTATPITCQNYSPTLSLTGYRGQINFQYSTDGVTYIPSPGGNSFVAQTIPGVVGGTFNTVHTPIAATFNTVGNYFFRGLVNYTQYGVLGSCEDIFTNVVTISSQFCTVTSAVVNTTTSPICLSQATVPGVLFGSASTLTGSVASILGWSWSFGSSAVPATTTTSTNVFPLVRYSDASNPSKNISLTLTGTGFQYVTTTTIQIDAFSAQSGIAPPAANLTICAGNFLTLSVNSTNLNPVLQWQSSPTGSLATYTNVTTSGFGENSRSYTTPGLSNSVFYRAIVQNGVCPSVTTTGRSISVIQPLTISPNLDQPIITICEGNNVVLSATGANGSIDYLSSTSLTGIYNTVAGLSLVNGVFATNYFNTTGNFFFKARISNAFNGCTQALSGAYTVSVVSCPVIVNFTGSGTFFTNRACVSSSSFVFSDLSPTISGVSFARWNWSFDAGATVASVSTTVGNNVSTSYSTEGVKSVNLTITAVAGIKTYTGTNFFILTVDGLSNAGPIIASNNPICETSVTGLSFNTTNVNPVIRWEVSTAGWNTIANQTTTSFISPPLLTTTGYRAVVTNGVCSSITSAIVIGVQPSPIVSLLSANVLTVCDGGRLSLSILGNNYSSIDWMGSTVLGFSNFDTVTVGSNSHTLTYLTDYVSLGNYYFMARLNSNTCNPVYSSVLTVSSISCPITPLISVSSAYFSRRTCYDLPQFVFQDNTSTIGGVKFVKYEWNFDADASILTQTTTNKNAIIPVQYTFPSQFFVKNIKQIQLVITGVSGNNTYTGSSFVTVTIDGIPTISGFKSIDNNLCTGNNGTGLFFTFNNPSATSSDIQWFQSTLASSNFTNFVPTTSTFHQTDSIKATTYYVISAANGVCPVFTTPSVVVTYYQQPEITGFTYPSLNYCNNQLPSVFPTVTRTGNTILGSYFISSGNATQMSVNPNNGSFVPNASILTSNSELFSVTYSIPGVGQCQPRTSQSQVVIGKKFDAPIFFYNSAPYCSSQGIATRVFNSLEGISGSYYTSNSLLVNPLSGNVDISVLTASGVHDVIFVIPPIGGCPSVTGVANLTITSAPVDFSFSFDKLQFCTDELVITVSSAVNVNDTLGYWSLQKTNPSSEIYISSVTGSVILTSLTSTDFYTVSYTKPARGGCFLPISKSQYFFVNQLPRTPMFSYGSPAEFCSSNANIVVLSSSNLSGGSFSTVEDDIFVGPLGKVTTPINTISGIRTIEYIIPPAGACKDPVVGTSQINFIKSYEPSFTYAKSQICNSPFTELVPLDTFDIGPGSGQFYSIPSGLAMNAVTGVITVSSITNQSNYTIYYTRPKPTVCGVGNEVSKNPASIFVEALPPNPFFKYNDFPICSNSSISPVSISGLLNNVFAAPNGFSINPNSGELFPSNLPEGLYVITLTNRSLLPGSVTTITCPLVSSFAVVTVGSNVSIPPFNYGNDKFCSDESTPQNIIGVTLTGGYFSANAGLDINTLTGTILINNSSTNGAASQYSINYRVDRQNGCPPLISSTGITIYKKQTQPSFSYAKKEYCTQELNPSPVAGSILIGGKFSAPSFITIDADNGTIDLSKSAESKGVIIQYRVPENPGCSPVVTTTSLDITSPDVPTISYGRPYCTTDSLATAFAFPPNGTFTGSIGLKLNTLTGEILLTESQKGISQVYYYSPAKGACNSQSAFDNVTINSPVKAPTISYKGGPFCHDGTPIIPIGSFQFGTFRASANVVFIPTLSGMGVLDSITGVIDSKASVPGKYTISYVVPSIGGCAPITVQDTLSIKTGKIGLLRSESAQGRLCSGNSAILTLTESFGNISWEERSDSTKKWLPSDVVQIENYYKTGLLDETKYFRAFANYANCPEIDISDTIKITVNLGPKGGTALADNGTPYREICNELSTSINLTEYEGNIRWQFSNDSIYYNYTSEFTDTIPKLTTPSQNEYGLKQWYRAELQKNNCGSAYSSVVLVKVCDKADFIPNVLTPNSDDGSGNQSYWVIKQLNLRDFAEVRVFNRYGSQVYFANGRDASERPWDGGGLPSGTYYYVIDRKDQTTPLTGSISIVK